jgi:Mrr restriction endonuclease-like protein
VHTIELSNSTYRRLLACLTAFGETPEDVIRRLLDEAEDPNPPREETKKVMRRDTPRVTPGSILAEHEYWRPILSVVAERGGSAPASDVVRELGERLKDSFTPLDLERLDAGEVRWRNRARFARLRLTQQGFLSKTSPRGVWEITAAGRSYLENG